jgi:hypothetical protein
MSGMPPDLGSPDPFFDPEGEQFRLGASAALDPSPVENRVD